MQHSGEKGFLAQMCASTWQLIPVHRTPLAMAGKRVVTQALCLLYGSDGASLFIFI